MKLSLRSFSSGLVTLYFFLVGCAASPSGVYVFEHYTYDSEDSIGMATRDIYSVGYNGKNVTRITTDPAEDYEPGLSRDGSKIAFVSERDSGAELYVMNVDGTNVTKISNNNLPARPYDVAWSPDGTKISFRAKPRNNWTLFVINADGTNLIALTDEETDDVSSYSWSADGTQIGFIGFPNDGSDDRQLYFIDSADGSNMTSINPEQERVADMGWSPDGTEIVITSFLYGDGEIALMKPDGSDIRFLAELTTDDRRPSWTLDGKHIIFVAEREGENDKFYIMNADGSNLKLLLDLATLSRVGEPSN